MAKVGALSSVIRRLNHVKSTCARLRRSSTARQSAPDIKIVEVGPRDGLQNEGNIIPLETKLELIRKLATTGLGHIEAGAFVAPKWVPQMANSAQILESLYVDRPSSPRPVSYSFLVPNIKGLENAFKVASVDSAPSNEAAGAQITSTQNPNEMPSNSNETEGRVPDEVSIFAAATETFSQKNTNCSIAESIERFQPVISLAKSRNVKVRAYISVVLGCPYEGPDVSPGKVTDLAGRLLSMGADEISLGDTTGMGTAPRTLELHRTIAKAGLPNARLAMHFHDTYGQALVNTAISLEHGITTFDSSVAGLGGCPYAKGATGNVATEDLVYLLHSLGLRTGVDIEEMSRIGKWISTSLDRQNNSRAGPAILAKLGQ